ncbi:ABC transporter ATP-binding protein [Streptomyces scopuliridis]|uniref:ABC transporter ATP-binding protein n=1 Tax=Streptomyces scopuliridis TaxID=452529 RepID=UPI0036AE9554
MRPWRGRRSRSSGKPTHALVSLARSYLRPYRRVVITVVALQLVQTLALLYLPTLSAHVIDQGVLTGDTGFILRTGGVMLLVSLLQVVCVVGAVTASGYAAMAVGRDIRAALFDRVQGFSSREVGSFGSASLVTRTTNDVQQVQSLVLAALTGLVSAPVMAFGGTVLALRQDVPMAVALVAVTPLLTVPMVLIVRRLRPLFRSMQQQVDAVNRVLREQITGMRVIRAFARDEYERRRFMQSNDELTEVAERAGLLTTSMFPLAATLVNLFSVLMVWLGTFRVHAGRMEVGALTAFLGYLTLILVAVVTATFMLMMMPRAEISAERIAEVLSTESSVGMMSASLEQVSRPGHLDLQGVYFSYPGAEEAVLRGVDLIARPGETTAVVGSTGSGKSTLLGLVPRLADTTAGRVLVGGEDVRSLPRSVLSRAVGFVPQTASLIAGTVASNLRFGRPDASDDDLWRALEVTQAKDFIEALDDGLEASVSQGGANFSGGQRQRLAIARVLVHRPHIYLLDDSFSALDYTTEVRLREAFAQEVSGAAVLMVSQRVASIRHADRIVVLESGAVVGTGTHDELLVTSPVYREIVLSQPDEETE